MPKILLHPLVIAISIALNSTTLLAKEYTVTNTSDSGLGSLRHVIDEANNNAGADNIIFSIPDGSLIELTSNEIDVVGKLTITGPTANKASSVTVEAKNNKRIFNGYNTLLKLQNITLRGGSPTSSDRYGKGGAIYISSYISYYEENTSVELGLILENVEITDNIAPSKGGAIFSSDDVTLTRSTISNNKTTGNHGEGGAIYSSGNVTLMQSTISGNSTEGEHSRGGGIHAGNGKVTLNQSTLSGNSTKNLDSSGGGIYAKSIDMTQSTISGNTVTEDSIAGGIFIANFISSSARPLLESIDTSLSTEKNKSDIKQSTITKNTTQTETGASGLYFYHSSNVTISNTIISGNSGGVSNMVIAEASLGDFDLHYNLLGNSEETIDPPSKDLINIKDNNIFDVSNNPQLGHLKNNGGLTRTHLANVVSKAIDKGNNSLAPAITDQRGTGYFRIIGSFIAPAISSTVDIGATERVILLNQALQCTKN